MIVVEERLDYRRLRAPRDDGQALIVPPPEAIGQAIADNEQRRHTDAWADYDVQGRTLGDVSNAARADLLQQALAYTRSYRDAEEPTAQRILLAGHQPQLFHPGVWFKNFALSHLAAGHDAVAINLLIDNDTAKSAAVGVPGGSVDAPVVKSISYDAASAAIANEERRIIDRDVLRGFGQRAAEQLRPLVPDPLLEEFWPRVVQRAEAHDNLGECLAQARHEMEGDWGGNTLEVPYSRVCQSEAFCWFVAHLLAHLPRLWEVHNASLAEYRRENRLRSASHPVPDLAEKDGWLEAPFWMWSRDDPHRRAVFARQTGETLQLTDRTACRIDLPLTPDADATAAAEVLAGLHGRGIKLRTRALTTTLWARLALGDLFVHGIGGAKYDQLTDTLIEQFFGLRPPGFLTISATLLLPIDRPNVREEDIRRVNRQLRELTFQPERHVDQESRRGPDAQAVVERMAEKRRWIDTQPTPRNARQRFLAIRAVNEQLQPWVAPQRDRLLNERRNLTEKLRVKAVVASRNYPFCFYPAEKLRIFMLEFPPGTT